MPTYEQDTVRWPASKADRERRSSIADETYNIETLSEYGSGVPQPAAVFPSLSWSIVPSSSTVHPLPLHIRSLYQLG